MAVFVKTDNPQALLNKFKAAVDQAEPQGKITTWKPSEDKNYYTHTSKQWAYEAWFQPVAENERLAFYIIKSKRSPVSKIAYGFYHGHMIETLLNHFDTDLDSARATSFPVKGDNVG